jgi:hypothetical protein
LSPVRVTNITSRLDLDEGVIGTVTSSFAVQARREAGAYVGVKLGSSRAETVRESAWTQRNRRHIPDPHISPSEKGIPT